MTQNIIPQRPWLNESIKSGDFEICANCNGTGSNPEYNDLNNGLYNAQISWGRERKKIIIVCCPRCGGAGYLDWIENTMGKKMSKYDELFINLEFNCVEFLISALTGPHRDYDICKYFDTTIDDWQIDYDELNIDLGLKNFFEYKPLVSDYLTDAVRFMFNTVINRAFIIQGKACTKCFDLVPNDMLYDRINRNYKLIPAIPDNEINYEAIYTPDVDFPLFRLCDICDKNTSSSEILDLKKIAFDENNTHEFSNEYLSIIYEFFPRYDFI
jgi:hypothetical protein